MKPMFFVVWLASAIAFANEDLSLPAGMDLSKAGFPEAPVIQCPRSDKKFEDMLASLDGLKAKIKKEACPQNELAELNKEIEKLENLAVDGRKEFVDLVQKGTSEGSQLNAKEVAKIQAYVDQVVKRVASITGLVNNPACFDENAKVSTLSFLSSLVGDVTGVIGALAGPFGAKISLGGQLAASLIGSIDTIVQARKTYDYETREDRSNYLNNLCAYYEFKGDLDKETQTLAHADRLWDMADASRNLLDSISKQCRECAEMVRDFRRRMGIRQTFEVEVDPLTAGNNEFSRRVSAEDMTLRELYEFYYGIGSVLSYSEFTTDQDLSLKAMREGQLVEPSLRIAAIRAVQAQSWAERELDLLHENDTNGLSDDGRREVMRVQKEIEDFLVQREARRYVDYYSGLLNQDIRNLERVARTFRMQLQHYQLKPDLNFDYHGKDFYSPGVFHDLFRKDRDYLGFHGVENDIQWKEEGVEKMRIDIVAALESVRLDYGILRNRCEFFSYSSFQHEESVKAACARGERVLQQGERLIQELMLTSFADRHRRKLEFVEAVTPNYVNDWLASITDVLVRDLEAL